MPFINLLSVLPVTAEGGLSFSSLWTEFVTDFGLVSSFFSSNPIFLAIIGLPIGAFAIGCIVKAIR